MPLPRDEIEKLLNLARRAEAIHVEILNTLTAEKFVDLKLELNVTAAFIAKKTGYSAGYVSMIESKRQPVTLAYATTFLQVIKEEMEHEHR